MHTLSKIIAVTLFVSAFTPLVASDAMAQNWSKVLDGVEVVQYNGLSAARIEIGLIGVSITPQVSAKGEPNPPKTWAQKHGLQVAINANFFSMDTMQNPCSFAVCNGVEWGSGWSDTNYASMGFTIDNRLKIMTQAETGPVPSWAYNLVSGSPEIVRDGKQLSVAKTPACVALTHCSQKAYRSGMGTDKEKKYLILAVTNSGMTVETFAERMISLGADYAINLDGGGSSGLYVNGTYYGNKSTRLDAVNLGFKVGPKPDYVCKAAEIDNPSNVFYDMPSNHWGLSAAQALANKGVTKGCGAVNGHQLFCPDCGTKRVQAAMFLQRAKGLQLTYPSSPTFSDVTESTVGKEGWGAVEACVKAGIVSKDTKFRPNDVLSRIEGATMIARAYISDIDSYANAPTPTFTDVPKSHWGYRYIEAMVRNCIATGTGDNKYAPSDPMTRIQFAALLARAAGYIAKPACTFTKQCQTNGSTTCSGNSIKTCVAFEYVSESCGSGMKCQNGKCVSDAECSGSGSECINGSRLRTCQSGHYVTTTCPAGYCENNRCVECPSNMIATCENNAVIYCANGTLQTTPCSQTEICQGDKCVATDGCTNGDRRCSGTTIQVCKNMSWQAETDCNLSGQTCDNATCITPRVCDTGTQICVDDHSLKTCNANGQWDNSTCDGNKTCHDGACVDEIPVQPDQPKNCYVGDLKCTGTQLQICQNDAWVTVIDCSASGQICKTNTCAAAEPITPDPEDPPVTPDPEDPPVTPDPDTPVTPDPDTPVTPDPDTPDPDASDPVTPDPEPSTPTADTIVPHTTVVQPESGCSQSGGHGHPLPWLLAVFGAAAALIRRRREN